MIIIVEETLISEVPEKMKKHFKNVEFSGKG